MDENHSESLKQMIHKWVNDRHQALLEQVMMTWQEGMGRLAPDDALLLKIQELLAPPPPRGGSLSGCCLRYGE